MDKINPAPDGSGNGAEVEKLGSANLSLSPQNINTPSGADTAPPEDRPRGTLKGSSARGQSTTRGSPVRHRINARYGISQGAEQFIVHRTVKPKSDRPRSKSEEYKPVAYFVSLEAALMWIVMRQAHFEDEPTIHTDILDAFQRYVHLIDRTKEDIKALAERLETAL